MAITNAQQYKQLVNPPMEGKKRPGYRGEAAAASDRAAGRNAGRDTSDAGTRDRGNGKATGAPNQGLISELRRQNLEKAPDVFKRPERFKGIRSLASKFNPISFLLGLANPALGFASNFFTNQVPNTFKTFKDSATLADFIKNIRREDDPPIFVDSGRGSDLRKPIIPINRINLNDLEGVLEDKGLRIAPSAIIDQGLREVPANFIDQGLREVPADFIDQGLREVPADFIDQGEIVPLATGGRVNAMGGGIMDLETGRQMYGLGKLHF